MRLSVQTLRILQLFAQDPSEPRYGLEVMDYTGLQSGTVYPALHRLEANGWLVSREEEVDASAAGRPARRLYHLTPDGLAGARAALEPFQAPQPVLKARLA
ncbi:helix-turn-helix transcriptional regulator [Solirubrobacter sp. CPCC 204708]|uniref:PadR family transcriptional regulator n=1 Tax=Solirubrobacter deserti TaxID=2282478 RepID=A0ABT4RT22_9ACTN|nr:PadR family transcriptional regulator [Solirubrobacter deserti]MBE2320339.1 helix-turn-helix transcriptional regulator [Solirubrobacter deserti]MDA0141691.1 PadR family transcriptional regulator [Solirubrobacter deserti]